jgi:predicted Fe-S protein YdhL (DUF1289 family)
VNNDINQKVKTPCIGVCSTGIGDSVCRGCKRFAHEVIHWNGYTDDQKQIIDRRLALFLSQIVATKLVVVDQKLLIWQLETQQISYQSYKSPYIWAYELLRAGASQIDELSHFGLQLQEAFKGYPLRELRLLIDEEFYLLSNAHYQRYFELDRDRVTHILEKL